MKFPKNLFQKIVSLSLLPLCCASFLIAQQITPPSSDALLLTVEGAVQVLPVGQTVWTAGQTNQTLHIGDQVRTAARSRATVRLSNLTVLRVNELTTLQIQRTNTVELPTVAQTPNFETMPGKGPLPKADWFQKSWAPRRTRFWNERANDKGAVVFLGDSITQGWKTLAQDFSGMKVANRGISGDTTRGVLYRLQEDVLDLEPKAIVLLIGTNDIGLGADPDDAASNVKDILKAVQKSNPKIPVIVCNVMPSNANRQRPADKLQKLNASVDDFMKGKKQFIRCDTWSLFADAEGNVKKEEFPDLLHPNATGYEKWTNALKPIFAKLGLEKKS